jgi:hypothetical protein
MTRCPFIAGWRFTSFPQDEHGMAVELGVRTAYLGFLVAPLSDATFGSRTGSWNNAGSAALPAKAFVQEKIDDDLRP